MELRAFAEHILFATSLEEKLRWVDGITDEQPGAALVTPEAPGRPAELQFKAHGTRTQDFPGLHQLENERERGRLLHFFANHELLATELMALVLLRFPDAPAAFRRGVLQTLKDEQMHTRLYLRRMQECGIEFGEIPVSGYFWRCVSPMEHPMDYVAALSLTFEQANLDFCRHFAQGFKTVGDTVTGRLLDRIYHDEIGHVAYGLKWFRRWKNPGQSDWEAFCRQLKFPLSPQRAKGITLNVEGRSEAGFTPDFIAELNVYSQSKGRTPNVFVFNPFAEGRIGQGKQFNPAKHQAALAQDLENLPQFLCRQDDLVLVRKRPSIEFLSGIKQAGFPLPEFVTMGDKAPPPHGPQLNITRDELLLLHPKWRRGSGRGGAYNIGAPATTPIGIPSHESVTAQPPHPNPLPPGGEGVNATAYRALGERKLGRLRPWAWSPDSVELLAPLFDSVTAEKRTPAQRFNEHTAQLYSKGWGADFLRKILTNGSLVTPAATPWLCGGHEVGVVVTSLPEALAAIAAIRRRGHHRVVAKQAYGLAGSNALRLWEPEILETQRRWLANSLAHHPVVIEPWLERAVDFSVQLEMEPGGLKLCGYTGLINDAKGQFQANTAEPHFRKRIPANVIALFPERGNIAGQLHQLYAEIFARLEAELRRAEYLGPVGIDAFVYRTPEGTHRLKPVVEINPRYTMGRVTVELMQQVCQGSSGLFRLINHAQLRAAGFEDFPSYARALRERHPLVMETTPRPGLRTGALCLNDPAEAQVCLAVFQVSRTGSETSTIVRG